jgi:hypothetical protein
LSLRVFDIEIQSGSCSIAGRVWRRRSECRACRCFVISDAIQVIWFYFIFLELREGQRSNSVWVEHVTTLTTNTKVKNGYSTSMMNSVYYGSLDDVAEVGDGSLIGKGSVKGNNKTRILT